MPYVRSSLRLILFIASTLVIYLFWRATAWAIPNKQLWRQFVFLRWAKAFARLAGMKVEVFGTPPKAPFLLVCNHLSYVDIPALRIAVEAVFVAKSDINDWFLAGTIIRNMGNIFINRSNRRDIPRAGTEVIRKLEENEGVIVFPEGTSTKGEDVLPFNSSFLEFAAKADVPVSYAAISYHTPEGEPPASSRVCWWEDISFMNHLRRLLSLREFTAVVTFGDKAIRNPNRKELAAELRQRVKEKFVPVL